MPVEAALPMSNTVTFEMPDKAAPAKDSDGLTFGEVLSDLNPLQYLPVVGTLYRAVTGDTIPKPLREAGSVLVGGLLGGPIGVATSLGTLAFEKLTGLDFEDVEQGILAMFGGKGAVAQAAPATEAATPDASSAQPAATLAGVATAAQSASPAHVAGAAWSPAQLAAYGVVAKSDGTLHLDTLSEADTLNAIQLREIAGAANPA